MRVGLLARRALCRPRPDHAKNRRRIALHQSYDAETGEVEKSHNDMLAESLRKAGVPSTTVAGMRRTPPEDAYIMTPAELSLYGVKTT